MACVPEFAARAIREYLAQRKADGDEDAARLLAKLPGKRRAKGLDLPGKSRKTRREERNERAAKIRAAVMERAGEACEWCMRPGFVLEWAHVIDGNGSRTAHEDVTTTAGVCADCHHRGWHSGDSVRRAWAYRNAKAWALKHGFKAALSAIEKKIAKLEECGRPASAGGTR